MVGEIRTFIAVELDSELHRALADVEADLQHDRIARLVRWVDPGNIHLTVKFLGGVEPDRMQALQQAVAQACSAFSPFTLSVGGLGAFPNTRRPNVIWVGLGGQTDVAAQIAESVDAACAALGFPREERPFSPHLTLGRVRRDARPGDRTAIGDLVAAHPVGELGVLRAEGVGIMKSDLRPTGSVYSRLAEIRLGRSGV